MSPYTLNPATIAKEKNRILRSTTGVLQRRRRSSDNSTSIEAGDDFCPAKNVSPTSHPVIPPCHAFPYVFVLFRGVDSGGNGAAVYLRLASLANLVEVVSSPTRAVKCSVHCRPSFVGFGRRTKARCMLEESLAQLRALAPVATHDRT